MDTIPTHVTAERGKANTSAAGAAPFAPVQAAREMAGVLGSALNMLELMASKMPPGADLRHAIEAECAAMRQASRAILKRAAEA